jgi:hypothetical protein
MLSKILKPNRILLLPLVVGFLLLLSLLFPVTGNASIAKLVNFQGKLTKASDGTNVTDGSYSMQFKIYDAPTGGSLLWTETWDGTSGTTKVNLTNGVFSVKLGSFNSLAGVDFTTGSLYLTVNVNITGSYDGEMLPRKQLLSAAFAFNANNLVGDGRIAVTNTSTVQSAMQVTYNPDSTTSNSAAIITASSNVAGAALKVVQNGSGPSAVFTGGNVGVGTITPTSTLYIQGAGGISPFIVASSTGVSLFTIGQNGSTTLSSLGTGVVKTLSGSLYNGLVSLSTDVTGTLATSSITGVFSTASGGTGTTTLGSLTIGSGLSITGGQNVLIGTSTQITLGANVITNISTGTLGTIFNISTSTNSLVINLPFATISNTGQLQAADFLNFSNKLGGSGTNGFVVRYTGASTTAAGALIDNGTVAGIGATSSLTSFNIQGTGTLNPFNVSSSTGAPLLRVLANGNVGIGSSTPVAKLVVNASGSDISPLIIQTNGSAGNYTATNSAITIKDAAGNETLRIFATDPNPSDANFANLYIGLQAGLNQATDNSTAGNNNTGLGYQSLYSNTSGSNNFANGYFALHLNNTGSNNFANGLQALGRNISGVGNFANGSFALFANTSGTENFANGDHSLYNNTIGNRNFANGNSALLSNIDGSDNIANGYQTLFLNNSGSDNIANGYQVLFSDTGSNNIATGRRALYSNSSGSGNVAYGYFAGYGISTGSNNIVVGVATSTASQNQITTGSNNISIGYDVAIASSTANSQLNIGNFIYGTNLSGTGTTISLGKVGIGTSTPGRTLTVVGDEYVTGARYDSNNASGTLGQLLQSTGTGTQWIATSTLGFASASSIAGTNGQVAYFNSANTLVSASSLLNNGTVVGVNATSSTVNFNIQGTGALNPFNVASSIGISLLTVLANGNVGIGSSTPYAQLVVEDNGGINAKSNVLFGHNNSVALSFTQENLINGLNNIGGGSKNFITGESNIIGATGPLNNTINGYGNVVTLDSEFDLVSGWNNNLSGTNGGSYANAIIGKGNNSTGTYYSLIVGNQNTAVTSNNAQTILLGSYLSLTAPSTNSNGIIGSGVSAGSPLANNTDYSLSVGYNNTVPAIHIYGGGSAARIAIATSTSASQVATLELQGLAATDPFNIASSSGSSILRVASSGKVGIGTTTPGNALTVIGSISSSALTSGNCVQAGTGGVLTTIASACGAGGSGNTAWTIGNGLIYNGTSTDAVLIGTSTPTTASFFVQGNGTKNPLTITSSTGASLFTVLANGNVGIGAISPSALLHVAGTVIIQPSANTTTAFQVQNASGASIFLVDTTPTYGATTTNYVANPGFEVNTNGWTASGTATTIARVTAHKYFGAAALQINLGTVATSGGSITLFSTAPAAGSYNFSFYARVDSASSTFNTLSAAFSTSTTFSACSLNSTSVSNSGWRRFNCSFTTSGNVTGLFIGTSDGVSRTIYIDSAQLQLGSVTTPYSIGNIQLRGIITSPVSLQPLSNSVTAFQIQDTSGASNLFVADTLNNKVGIGTSTPTATFSLQGSSGNEILDIASSTGVPILHITTAGNVGIGTTSPISQFTVNSIATLSNDQVTITNANNPVTASGISNLQMTFVGGAAAVESSAERIDITPGTTSGGTWNGKRVVAAATGPLSGVTLNLVKLQSPTSPQNGGVINFENYIAAGSGAATGTITGLNISSITGGSATETAISIGTGWDSALLVGTTSTTSLVSIYGNASSPQQNIFTIGSSSGFSILTVAANGKVGIGTSTPLGILQIHYDASSTANSAFYTASTTNGAILQLGQKTLTSPNVNGTYLGLNTPSTFTGDVVNFQVNGSNVFNVSSAGGVIAPASSSFGAITLGANATVFNNGNAIALYGGTAVSGLARESLGANFLDINYTSGSGIGTQTNHVFDPTSGTGIFNDFQISSKFNQTTTSNGITRGLYVNPILTSVYDYRNLEVAATTTTINNAANPAQTVYNVLFNPITYQTSSTTQYTIATSSTLTISGAPIASTTSLALTNSIGLLIQSNNVTASTTNGIGLQVSAPTGATNNYAALFTGGNVGIGTNTPAQTLQVNGNVGFGAGARTSGNAVFYNSANLNTVSLLASTTSSSYALALPTVQGSSGQTLQNDGSGNLSWATPSAATLSIASAISGSTNGSVLFVASGQLQQNNSNFFWDNTNSRLGIGTSTPTQALSVVGSVSNLIGSSANVVTIATTTSLPAHTPQFVSVSGRYAYVLNNAGSFSVVDVSNPLASVQIVNVLTGVSVNSLYVSAGYAYIGSNGGTLLVYDISKPYAPVKIATSASSGSRISGVYVSGRYLYASTWNGTMQVFDISNPYSPTFVVSVSNGAVGGTQLNAITGSGRYIYSANGPGTNSISVFDISNPTAPLLTATTTVGGNPNGIAISGRYAYVTNFASSTMSVVDIASSTAPSQVGTTTVGTSPYGIAVSGRYAYVANQGSASVSVVDISSPTAPYQVAVTTVGVGPTGIFISGRYAYVANQTANTMSTIDLSGTETTSLIAHSAEIGSLQVRNDIIAQGQLQVLGGINVGYGGIFSNGSLSIAATSTPSYIGGSLGIGTSTPQETLHVLGNILLGKVPDATAATTTLIGTAGTFGADLASGTSASVIYNGKLFVATAALNAAAVYRLDGSTWTRITNAPGKVLVGDNVENDAYVMTIWNGSLYIGSQTGSATGHAALWSSPDAATSAGQATWTQVNTTKGTFGATASEDGVGDIAVWNNQIYFSTQKLNSSEVYAYKGGTNVGAGAFKTTSAATGKLITGDAQDMDDARLVIYNGRLYAGAITNTSTARVEAWDGSAWVLINTTRGTFETGVINYGNVDALAVYSGSLMISVSTTTNAALIYRYDGSGGANASAFHVVSASAGKIATTDAADIDSIPILKVYNGRLYAGSQATEGTAAFYEFDPTAAATTSLWTMLNTSRGAFGLENSVTAVSAMVDFNSILYIGTQSATTKDGVYTWSKTLDNSYGVRFDSGKSIGKISFVGTQLANDNSSRGGTFLFTHGVALNTGAFDYAEDYPTVDTTLEAGDVAQIDSSISQFVKKSTSKNNFIGIVSENPGFRLSLNQDKADAKYVPIALSGRVPVKVSTENGPIKAGDFLTASALHPGVATKAIKAGQVVAQALEGYDGTDVAKIQAFVNVSYFDGNVEDSGLTLDGAGSSTTPIQLPLDILSRMLAPSTTSSSTPQITITDELQAGLQVITPKLTAKYLSVDEISPALTNILNFSIPDGGKVTIGKSAGITFDSNGNGSFTGTLTAQSANLQTLKVGHIDSPDLSALANSITQLSTSVTQLSTQASSTAFDLTSLTANYEAFAATTTSQVGSLTDKVSTMALDLDKLTKASSGLSVDSEVILPNGLSINTLNALGGSINITGDINFIGRPYFTTDTAGFAQISSGQKEVEIKFDNPYLEQPIVNVTITLNAATSTDATTTEATTTIISDEELAQSLFDQDIRFVVIKKSENGFTIILNKNTTQNITFSWIALAVKSAKTFSSIDQLNQVTTTQNPPVVNPDHQSGGNDTTTPVVVPDSSGSSTPTVLGDSTTTLDRSTTVLEKNKPVIEKAPVKDLPPVEKAPAVESVPVDPVVSTDPAN